MRFGRLIALSQDHKDAKKNWLWLCQCDCGKTKVIRRSNLVSGFTKSCGCLLQEYQRTSKIKHGLSKTRFYHIWSGMYRRCYKSYNTAFYKYGAKGITVYEEWHRFQGFMDDMYESYKKHCEEFGEKNTTIDRIDGTKGYYPENVRWATYKEQANNKILNVKNQRITDIDGKEISINDFLKKYNLTYAKYKYRLSRGHSLEEVISNKKIPSLKVQAFKEPLEKFFSQFTFLNKREVFIIKSRYGLFGEPEKTLSEIGKVLNITKQRVSQIEERATDIILNNALDKK